jgi:hypothetical protein
MLMSAAAAAGCTWKVHTYWAKHLQRANQLLLAAVNGASPPFSAGWHLARVCVHACDPRRIPDLVNPPSSVPVRARGRRTRECSRPGKRAACARARILLAPLSSPEGSIHAIGANGQTNSRGGDARTPPGRTCSSVPLFRRTYGSRYDASHNSPATPLH